MPTVYAVASSKGGVGKTTTTVNLGTTLASAGASVAVVDGDIGMANLGDALGIETDRATLHDVLAGTADVEDATYEGPAGLAVVPGDTSIDGFRAADPANLAGVLDALDDYDYVLVDTGAGLSHDTVLPLGLADEVLLVSTTERDSLTDTEKTREVVDRLGGTTRGVVLTCVDPDDPNAAEVADRLGADVIEAIPADPVVRESMRRADPLPTYAPESPAASAYRALAGGLTGESVPASESGRESGDEAVGASEGAGTASASGAGESAGTAGADTDDTATEAETDADDGITLAAPAGDEGDDGITLTDAGGDEAASDDEATENGDATGAVTDADESEVPEATTDVGADTDDAADADADGAVAEEATDADVGGVDDADVGGVDDTGGEADAAADDADVNDGTGADATDTEPDSSEGEADADDASGLTDDDALAADTVPSDDPLVADSAEPAAEASDGSEADEEPVFATSLVEEAEPSDDGGEETSDTDEDAEFVETDEDDEDDDGGKGFLGRLLG
jgi:septum site-determining protein MinD